MAEFILGLGIFGDLLILFIAICYLLLPFAVFGIKDYISEASDKVEENTAQLKVIEQLIRETNRTRNEIEPQEKS